MIRTDASLYLARLHDLLRELWPERGVLPSRSMTGADAAQLPRSVLSLYQIKSTGSTHMAMPVDHRRGRLSE
jgi:hypothetical protein